MSHQIELFGVNVESIDQEAWLNRVVAWARQPVQVTISYVNAHCLNLAARDGVYRELLNHFDLVYSDGVGVVWAGQVLRGSRLYKVTGRALLAEFCSACQRESIRIYLLGGKPGVARQAQIRLQQRSPLLQVSGACDGYFQEKTESDVLDELADLKPDILLVGMGVPRQEKWIARNRAVIPAKVCWAVGALIDYAAGVEPPVPQWMERLALEWLWRLMVDPKDKWRRYLLGNPQFIARVLLEKIR